jgi:hypothetical protein
MRYILFTSMIAGTLFLSFQTIESKKINRLVMGEHRLPVPIDTMTFSPDSLYGYLQRIGMKYPRIVYKQALLESGRFKSDLFKNANNLFGMRMPNIRKTTAISKYKGYAKFSCWKHSVDDYKLYQDAYLSSAKTEEQYYRLLDKKYGATGKYSYTLKRMNDETLQKNK